MGSVKYSCSSPSYIFILFLCTSFLKISYCVNVLNGACTHHGLLLSIHFLKGLANSASVILIGLIFLFLFIFFGSFALSFHSRRPHSCDALPKHLNREDASTTCYPVLHCLMLAFRCKRARERFGGADGLGVKRKRKK